MFEAASGSGVLALVVGSAGRGAVLVILGVVAAAALRRSAAALRRGVWAAVVTGLLLMPLTAAVLPPLSVPLLPPPGAVAVAVPGSTVGMAASAHAPPMPGAPLHPAKEAPAPSGSALARTLALFWLAGVLLVLQRVIRAHLRIARVARATSRSPATDWRASTGVSVDVRVSDQVDLPMTVGVWRPFVLMPSAAQRWSAAWRRAVVTHEAAHVRRRDPAVQLLADLACALYWFHPLVWLAARELRIERELAADDDVLLGGTPGSEYAACLIGLATSPALGDGGVPVAAVAAPLGAGGLKARLLGILDPRRRRTVGPRGGRVLAAMGVLLFLTAAAASPSRRAPATPPPLAAGGPAPAPADDLVLARGHGPVFARVLDAGTGRPVAGAEVDFYFRSYMGPPSAVRVIADAAGLVRRPTAPLSQHRVVLYARSGPLAARTQVLPVSSGGAAAREIALRPAHTISGRVRDDRGVPIAGAVVRFDGAEDWAVAPGHLATALSDERGRFHFRGVLHGNYRLVVESPRGTAAVLLARVDTTDVSGLEITLARRWSPSGYLLDEAGRPVAGARIARAGRPPGPRRHIDWDLSAADGSFSILPLGQRLIAYRIDRDGGALVGSFSDRGEVHLVEHGGGGPRRLVWRSPSGAPQRVILRRGARVSGTARLPGGGLASGATVHAASIGGGSLPGGFGQTDRAGRFGLGPVEPGEVTVNAIAPGGFRAVTRLTLAPGEQRGDVDLVLETRRPVAVTRR